MWLYFRLFRAGFKHTSLSSPTLTLHTSYEMRQMTGYAIPGPFTYSTVLYGDFRLTLSQSTCTGASIILVLTLPSVDLERLSLLSVSVRQ